VGGESRTTPICNLGTAINPRFSDFLASIIDATDADFGNLQLFNSKNRILRIVAHGGLKSEFLEITKMVFDSPLR